MLKELAESRLVSDRCYGPSICCYCAIYKPYLMCAFLCDLAAPGQQQHGCLYSYAKSFNRHYVTWVFRPFKAQTSCDNLQPLGSCLVIKIAFSRFSRVSSLESLCCGFGGVFIEEWPEYQILVYFLVLLK
jgi:hypothetical protein